MNKLRPRWLNDLPKVTQRRICPVSQLTRYLGTLFCDKNLRIYSPNSCRSLTMVLELYEMLGNFLKERKRKSFNYFSLLPLFHVIKIQTANSLVYLTYFLSHTFYKKKRTHIIFQKPYSIWYSAIC